MPEKKTDSGQRFKVTDKRFEWTTEEGQVITIPMRVKMKVIRGMSDQNLDAAAMFEMLEKIAPGQGEILDEMDVNDFTACFTTWQSEYTALAGATPGE